MTHLRAQTAGSINRTEDTDLQSVICLLFSVIWTLTPEAYQFKTLESMNNIEQLLNNYLIITLAPHTTSNHKSDDSIIRSQAFLMWPGVERPKRTPM